MQPLPWWVIQSQRMARRARARMPRAVMRPSSQARQGGGCATQPLLKQRQRRTWGERAQRGMHREPTGANLQLTSRKFIKSRPLSAPLPRADRPSVLQGRSTSPSHLAAETRRQGEKCLGCACSARYWRGARGQGQVMWNMRAVSHTREAGPKPVRALRALTTALTPQALHCPKDQTNLWSQVWVALSDGTTGRGGGRQKQGELLHLQCLQPLQSSEPSPLFPGRHNTGHVSLAPDRNS